MAMPASAHANKMSWHNANQSVAHSPNEGRERENRKPPHVQEKACNNGGNGMAGSVCTSLLSTRAAMGLGGTSPCGAPASARAQTASLPAAGRSSSPASRPPRPAQHLLPPRPPAPRPPAHAARAPDAAAARARGAPCAHPPRRPAGRAPARPRAAVARRRRPASACRSPPGARACRRSRATSAHPLGESESQMKKTTRALQPCTHSAVCPGLLPAACTRNSKCLRLDF